MEVFIKLLSIITKKNSHNFLFLSQFNEYAVSIHNITNYEFTKYKYFILKNFLFAPTVDDTTRQAVIETFNNIQKKYLALLRFKNIVHFKLKKHLDDRIDLQFNNLDLMDDKYKITLINNNVKYQFSIFDLIKIINTALSYHYRFFPEPTTIKNPWDNSIFTHNNLYNIYFFIKNVDNVHMPVLLFRFFQSNFCTKHFLDNNQLIIKKFIINNCKNLPDDKKIYYIRTMLKSYNIRVSSSDNSDGIYVDKLYPDKKLIHIFDDYLKMYLSSKYSYESDIRIKNRINLNKRLKLFKNNQPTFGRKIIYHDIIKLYYISVLHHNNNDDQFIYFCNNIPSPDLIFIECNSFIVDYIPDRNTEYSVFPMYRKTYKSILNNNNNIDLHRLLNFINQFNFNKCQIDIIKTKGYDTIVKNKVNRNAREINYNLFDNDNPVQFIELFRTRNSNYYIQDIEYTDDDDDVDDDDDHAVDTYDVYDDDDDNNYEETIDHLIEMDIIERDNINEDDTDSDSD